MVFNGIPLALFCKGAVIFYQPHCVVDLLLVVKRKTRGRTKTTSFTLTRSVEAMVNDVLIIVILNFSQPRIGWSAAVQRIKIRLACCAFT